MFSAFFLSTLLSRYETEKEIQNSRRRAHVRLCSVSRGVRSLFYFFLSSETIHCLIPMKQVLKRCSTLAVVSFAWEFRLVRSNTIFAPSIFELVVR